MRLWGSLALLLVAGIGLVTSGQATSHVAALFDLGFGARALGMGGAFVGLADDEAAAFYNPAGLGWGHGISVSSFYTGPGSASALGALAVTGPCVGLTVMQLDSGLIGSGEGAFRYLSQAGLIAGGLAIGPLGLGGAVKLYRVADPVRGQGVAFEPACLLVTDLVRVGAVIENALGVPITYSTGHVEKWDTGLRIGVAMTLPLLGGGLACNAALDAVGLLTSSSVLRGGVETWIAGLGFRVGYDGHWPTAGLSLRLRNVQVDWAIALRAALGDAQRVSVAFRF